MMTVIFWGAFALIAYAYVGYPLCLCCQAWLWPKPTGKRPLPRPVSVVIAARNEERTILARLENLAAQHYPPELVEIIVVSDGSTDGTAEQVNQCGLANVRLFALAKPQGKAAALNLALEHATGEIVVFADARQRFAPEVLAELAANFADPSVGCVSGELLLVKDGQSRIEQEMGAYWRYEKLIRKLESRSGSVVGASGAIYALRRELFTPLPAETILDDVLTPLNIVGRGYRCLFDETAVALDSFSRDARQEWPRKVRTLAGNWQLLSLQPGLLLPWRNPLWFRLVSHKLLRLLVPLALPLLLVSSLLLTSLFYRLAGLLQLVCYALALAGVLLPIARRMSLLNFCYFFIVLNAAALVGFQVWVTGRCGTSWKTVGVAKGSTPGQ